MASKKHLCSTHPTENIEMYCSDFDYASCFKCVFGPHRGHHFDPIEDVVYKKRTEVQKYLKHFEGVMSSFTSALNSVKINYQDYIREIETLTEKVNKKREEWKKQIDEIADTVLSEMHNFAEKDLGELKKRQTALTKNAAEVNEFLKTCKERERTADDVSVVKLLTEFKQEEKIQPKSCPVPTDVCPPEFIGDRIETIHLREAFGRMVRDNEEAASDFAGSVNQCVAPYIDTKIIAAITPGITSTCVSAVGNDKAWVGYRYGSKAMALVNKGGWVLQRIDLGFNPGDITTTYTGEVIVTDNYNRQLKKYTKNGQYVNTIMTTSTYYPMGLCITSDNDILICLSKSKDNKVMRVTATGQTKQTIQQDKQNRPLFFHPELVQENINKDVCIVDSLTTLVVMNKDGEFGFRYPDRSTHSASISYCEGIVCDGLGNILLSDRDNHRIHMIDINGKFIQYVLDEQHGINYPLGLSITNEGELWVCNENRAKIVVFRYRS